MTTVQRDARQLRNFGLLVGGMLGAIGLWPPTIRGENPRLWAVALGAALVFLALVLPKSLGPVHQIWMGLGNALNWINSRIILGAIFYGLLTPIGLAMRRLGHDPMRRKFEPHAETYRVVRRPRPAAHMMRQF